MEPQKPGNDPQVPGAQDNNESQDQNTPPQKPTKGYGKRPLWQWIVIYLIIAIVVYGLIYLLFFSGGGGSFTY